MSTCSYIYLQLYYNVLQFIKCLCIDYKLSMRVKVLPIYYIKYSKNTKGVLLIAALLLL